jgi:leader peptidase (prepilin peptidase)/N-methyltransferase
MQVEWLFIRDFAALAGLSVLSAEDLKRKEVSMIPVTGMAMIGTMCSILGGEWADASFLMRFIPGLLALLLARVSGERIGYGDGWVLLCLGCYLSAENMINLCMISLFCIGIVALFMLLVLHRSRQAQIPFVPFLLLGYVLTLLAEQINM